MFDASTRFLVGLSCVCVLAATPARAQVASLGEGWLLGPLGSVTSSPAEVLSGRNSIKGSGTLDAFLLSDPGVIKFSPNQSYAMTVTYRIIAGAGVNFDYGFNSSTGVGNARDFGPGALISGSAGSSGTVTTTFTLHNWPDYQVAFRADFATPSAIVIDDVRITNASGQLVAAENAEGPTVVPGPLNYQITDATAVLTSGSATVMGTAVKDLDGDGYPEAILTITNAGTIASLFQPIVIESRGRMRTATTDFFPTGAPTTMETLMILFGDINGAA